jgi:hypothetical protein
MQAEKDEGSQCPHCGAAPKKGRGKNCYQCGTVIGIPALRGSPCLKKELAALTNWAGRVLEFLDVFEGWDDGDSKYPPEAAALQEEGLKLGLVRLPSTWAGKRICKNCGWWAPEFESGYCECPASPLLDLLTAPEDYCDYWEEEP